MKILVIAILGLLSASAVFAAGRLSAGCKAGIQQDLQRAGYVANEIRLVSKKRGLCDGETCNPDTLKLQVEAETRSERLVDLVVEASGPSRGDDWCRVTSIKVAR